MPRTFHRIVVVAAIAGGALTPLGALEAQAAPPKPRLELADSAQKRSVLSSVDSRAEGVRTDPAAGVRRVGVPATATAAPPSPAPADVAPAFRADFVRNQALLGAGLYAPALASTIARDGVAWGASYLLVAGGSYVAAAELSREMTITDPMQHLSTWMPVQGAVAGAMLGEITDARHSNRALAILVGSVGGTATALWRGRGMNAGEAAATTYGANTLGLIGFGAATAMGLNRETAAGATNKTRLTISLGGMVAGAPLGHAYAALAPYHVTPGDLSAMSAAAGVGMLAGLTAIANVGDRTDRQVASALTIGGIAGLLAGDRLLVRRYDHTPAQGRFVTAGGVAGALMGAGVSLVIGGDDTQWGTLSAALTTAGAAGGILLTQRYALPAADGVMRLGSLQLNPAAMVAAASGMRGSFTLGSFRF